MDRKSIAGPSAATLPAASGGARLEAGDHLDRAAFHRRYEQLPEIKKAELIDGVVFMPSPTRLHDHATPHGHVVTWLGTYQARTPSVGLADNATVFLSPSDEVQPDALLRLDAGAGGRTRVGDGGYLDGPPELVVEIAASSASYDLHAKRRAFERAGVAEYAVVVVAERRVVWWQLEEGRYQPLQPDGDGIVRSRRFPGLWLAVEPLLAGDLGRVLDVQADGLASDEHAAFVRAVMERLQRSSD